MEPLIGDLGEINLTDIDWVIVGGESGSKSSPMNLHWVRDIRDQCIAAHVPFFFKQWGDEYAEWIKVEGRRRKAKAEPMIDGKYWLQFPTYHPAAEHKRKEVLERYSRELLAPYRVRTADKIAV